MSFKVKFWGVRGSIACPSPSHVMYGGNTSCVEMVLNGQSIIFDAGTGIRNLGHDFLRRNVSRAYLLLTHTHWDHINGFPFFAPIFNPDFKLDIMAGHLSDKGGIKEVLASQMATPTFPVPFEALKADLAFIDFRAGSPLELKDLGITVKTAYLRHPNGSTAYRVEHENHSVCLVTDTEHLPGKPDENILELIEGSDLVIYDCTYTDEEFSSHIGWGHSTWQEGVRLCRSANVKRMAIFHHDPDHDDSFMGALEDQARAVWDAVVVSRDNMELTVF